jgi:hypothetical protein
MEAEVTVISIVVEAVPPSPIAANVTVNAPEDEYVFFGDVSTEVVPSPKLQVHEVKFSDVFVN